MRDYTQDAPVFQEEYYRDVPITVRLRASRLDDYLPARPLPLLIALLVIAAGAFRLGLLMASPYEYRGWAALVVFSIIGSVWIIYSRRED